MDKPVLVAVVGHHRGGTSATAGALRRLGVYFGEDNELMPPSEANPKGYTEHKELVAAHDQLLQGMRVSWDSASPLPPRWRRGFPFNRAVDRLSKLVESLKESEAPVLGVKDPRMTRVRAVWDAVADRTGVRLAPLVVMRDMRAVCASLKQREKGPDAARRGEWDDKHLWQMVSAYEAGLHEWLEHPGARRVRFPDLLQWRTNLWPALRTLVDYPALALEDGAEHEVDDFLDVGLLHHG